jgi:agmatinase
LFCTPGFDRESVAKLLQAGILVEVGEECAEDLTLSQFIPTFLGCPEGAIGEAQVSVIGIPCDALSQTGSGSRAGAAALRVASNQLGWGINHATGRPRGWYDYTAGRRILADTTFVDAGDIEPFPGESAAHFGSRIARATRRCIALESVPVFLGGDHSISYWTINAIREAFDVSIAVLHLDAHSDLSERTKTGVPTNGSFARWLIEENPEMAFVTVGLRGYVGAEQPLLSQRHTLIGAADVIRTGPGAVLLSLPKEMPCYVSFDIDLLDPAVAPGTNVLVPGGLSFERAREILTTVGAQRRIVGVDIVELNPERDLYGRSAFTAVNLLLALLGCCCPNSPDLGDGGQLLISSNSAT